MMVYLGVPDDPELLRELGRLAVAHANLEMSQIMCLKTLEGLAPGEALRAYRLGTARQVRERAKGQVRKQALDAERDRADGLCALVDEAWNCSGRRNAHMHRFYGQTQSGEWWTSPTGSDWIQGLPDAAAVEALVVDIERVANALNRERFGTGYLLLLANRRLVSVERAVKPSDNGGV